MTALTPYEVQVVDEIAWWKTVASGPYHRWTSRFTKPVAAAFNRVMPKALARRGIESVLATPTWLSNPREILDKAGVTTMEELGQKPLEFCDQLAARVARGAHSMAVVDGVVAGTCGLLLATAEVGALAVLSLRAIQRTGYCYGFELNRRQDRPYLLGVLLAATAKSAEERRELLDKLRQVESSFLSEAVEAVAINNITARLLSIASLEAIPWIGTVFGSAANLAYMRQVTSGARRVFQERRLRTEGKFQDVPIDAPWEGAGNATPPQTHDEP